MHDKGLSLPSTNIEIPQADEPSRSQKRFPLMCTNININAIAERSLTTPKIPVRKRDDETEVNPADMKMTGASKIGSKFSPQHVSNRLLKVPTIV
jgi:hypothetical protein